MIVVRTVEGNHMRQHREGGRSNQREVDVIIAGGDPGVLPDFPETDIGVTAPYRLQASKGADVLDQAEADTVHRFQGRQKQVVILTTVLDETWRGRTGLPFVDDPQMINVAVSRAVQRFILVTNYDMLPTSRHIRDLVGYIRYHHPGEDAVDSTVVSVFDLLYRAYSERLRPLAARLRNELRYPSEDIIWTVMNDIITEQRYAHMTASPQVLLRNLLPDLGRLTPAQRAYVQHRASVDFVVYNRVTNHPLLAIEVDGFAFHENNPAQRARDALKDEILAAHQMPLLRLPTTGSGEHQRIWHAWTRPKPTGLACQPGDPRGAGRRGRVAGLAASPFGIFVRPRCRAGASAGGRTHSCSSAVRGSPSMKQNVRCGTYPGGQMKALAADDPRVIGEYRLRAQLGAGGMGRVYLGLSPAGRAVAIKVVHPELASDADFLRRFAQEVAAARAVSGIYTAPVVASGLNERPPWLATAFVPGPSLEQVVTEHGPLPEQALWPLLGGLVEALQAIHACGVVHRDLKPANVLLATDGPRVIDFGISRAADGTSLTAAGVVFGTPGYMSPEQAEGRGAGPESDVFALACVVAYGAAGMGPFGTGTAAAVLYRVVHAEPDLSRVPPKLREVLAACLAKNPAARPTLRALSGMLAGNPDSTGPSAVAFWPSSVAGLIGEYQARLELETRNVSRPADGFSWANPVHPRTTPSDPGRPAARPSPAGWPPAGGGASPSPAPSPGQSPSPGQTPPTPSPRWPYGGAVPRRREPGRPRCPG